MKMRLPIHHSQLNRLFTYAVCLVAVLFVSGIPYSFGESQNNNYSEKELYRLGERIYQEGILPSGQKIQTMVNGDNPLPGSAFTCVSCHQKAGFGSVEERIYSPPVAGPKLFAPSQILFKGVSVNPRNFVPAIRRPAYTESTLITAIRTGVDPTGRTFSSQMSRYILDDQDAFILVSYLKQLSSKPSPGVSDSELIFATVITDDVSQAEQNAMVDTLDKYIAQKNNLAKFYKKTASAKSRLMAENMLDSKEMATKQLRLLRWHLKGAPETWRKQLNEYYAREQVFALIGGLSKTDWKPIHQFSEENRIPCLFPNTSLPEVSNSDWYTLYLSKGFYQEGEAAARYLSGRQDLIGGQKILQIVRSSSEGRALSQGFVQALGDPESKALVTVKLKGGEKLTGALLGKLMVREKPAVLVVWDNAEALPALESLLNKGSKPEMLFMSSRYIGEKIWSLKEPLRAFSYLTYPYAFTGYNPKLLMGRPVIQPDLKSELLQSEVQYRDDIQKTESLTIALTQVLTSLLMDMRGNYVRDNFLDAAGMMMDQQYPLYGKISFGTSERYVSKGCYIAQLTQGVQPKLVKKSDWLMH